MADNQETTVQEEVGSGLDAIQALEVVTTGFEGAGVLVKAELDASMVAAKQYPRKIKGARELLKSLAVLDEETAKECVYALSRQKKSNARAPGREDKKAIEGPSIRFAEMVASCWGNIRAASRIISEGDRYITAQGVCIDLQTNNHTSVEILRRITTSRGERYSTDMIGVTGNAAASIARRNAILGNIPKAFWREAYDAARLVITGDVKTFGARRDEAFARFAHWGVTPDMLATALGRDTVEDIVVDDLVTMWGMYQAIKNEDQTVESMFGLAGGTPAVEGGFNPLARGAAKHGGEGNAGGEGGGESKPKAEGAGASAPKDDGKAPAAGAQAGAAAPKPARQRKPKAAAASDDGGAPPAEKAATAGAVRTEGAQGDQDRGSAGGEAARSDVAEAPPPDVLKELSAQVAAAKNRQELESIYEAFRPVIEGKLNADEDAFVEQLITDRFNQFEGGGGAPGPVEKEERWDAKAAHDEIMAGIVEQKTQEELRAYRRACEEGMQTITASGALPLRKALDAAFQMRDSELAQPAPAPAADEAGEPWERWKEYMPRDERTHKVWKELVAEMSTVTTTRAALSELTKSEEFQRRLKTLPEDHNIFVVRFNLGKRLPP